MKHYYLDFKYFPSSIISSFNIFLESTFLDLNISTLTIFHFLFYCEYIYFQYLPRCVFPAGRKLPILTYLSGEKKKTFAINISVLNISLNIKTTKQNKTEKNIYNVNNVNIYNVNISSPSIFSSVRISRCPYFLFFRQNFLLLIYSSEKGDELAEMLERYFVN